MAFKKSLKLNQQGDLEISSGGNLKMIEGTAEVAQRNRLKIGTHRGEWIFNLLMGIPWIDLMAEKPPAAQDIKRALRQALREDEDIKEVLQVDFEYNPADRTGEIYFEVLLINGERIAEEAEVI